MDATPTHSSRPAPDAPAGAPLAGVRVLDLSGYIAAPYGCTLLADQGAEVLKIEPPEGDNLRKYPSSLAVEGRAFLGVNRGKHGLVLDLKKPEGLAVLHRLVEGADVLVHNFRPAVPARLGIDYPRLRAINPRLVYCAVSGFGESGPLRNRAGYDQVLQAMTGICAMQGAPGQPQIVYGSVVDYYAAGLLAASVSSALFAREHSGQGRYVGVSLLRSALAMQSARMVWAEGEPREVSRDMRSGGVTGIHPTREGHLYVSANTPHFWAALCTRIGLPELAQDERYDSVRKRARRAEEIVPLIRAALMQHSAREWEALFGEAVPCAAVRQVEDMFDDPQVLAESMIREFNHPLVGRYRGLASAFSFGPPEEEGNAALAGRPQRSAPVFGQDTDKWLARVGYSADDIQALRERGAVA